MMKLNKLFFVLLLSGTTVSAQDINTTQVKVVEGFKPTIPEASRLNENAIFADTIKYWRNLILNQDEELSNAGKILLENVGIALGSVPSKN